MIDELKEIPASQERRIKKQYQLMMEKVEKGHHSPPTTTIELIRLIRLRHQMFANNIDMLAGILIGFGLSRNKSDEEFEGFHNFLAQKLNLNPSLYSWMEMVKLIAMDSQFEVSIFFSLWDEFRNIDRGVVADVVLTRDQRYFDFQRRMAIVNIDKPELPLKAPHKIKAIKMFDNRVHATFFDENEKLYYEVGLRNFEQLLKWSQDCFDVPKEQWKINT